MSTKYIRYDKKMDIQYELGIEAFIERVKKLRALNCNPSDVGMSNYVFTRFFFNKPNSVRKFL